MNLFVPIVFTVMIANYSGSLFTRGLYDRAIRGKQIPLLVDWVPEPCKEILAEKMMSCDLKILQRVDTVENVYEVLNTTTHHAFPVVNGSGNLIGLIPRNFLITVIKNSGWYYKPEERRMTLSTVNDSIA